MKHTEVFRKRNTFGLAIVGVLVMFAYTHSILLLV
jgi:hypothetical protein